MKYKKRVEDRVEVYGKIINLKQKFIDLKQKPKLKGEMTIEASLVIPMVFLMLAFKIIVEIYLHDIIYKKVNVYVKYLEMYDKNEKTEMERLATKAIDSIPVFVADNKIKKANKSAVTIESKYNFQMRWIKNIMDNDEDIEIKIEKNMDEQKMYICKAVIDSKAN